MGNGSIELAKQAPGKVCNQDTIRLFLIEDSPTTRLYIKLLLEFEGTLEIIGEAGQLSEALDALGELSPDLILLDFNLPDVRGTEAIPKLRQKLPSAYLIVVSVEEVYREQALAAGANAFLVKPFSVNSLVQVLSLRSQPFQLAQI